MTCGATHPRLARNRLVLQPHLQADGALAAAPGFRNVEEQGTEEQTTDRTREEVEGADGAERNVRAKRDHPTVSSGRECETPFGGRKTPTDKEVEDAATRKRTGRSMMDRSLGLLCRRTVTSVKVLLQSLDMAAEFPRKKAMYSFFFDSSTYPLNLQCRSCALPTRVDSKCSRQVYSSAENGRGTIFCDFLMHRWHEP